MPYDYRELDGHTYHIAPDPAPYLRQWLRKEWLVDAREFPDQPWTREWLGDLTRLEFRLEVMALVRQRQDLMSYAVGDYRFADSLAERVAERIDAIQMGTSIMPLVVRAADGELMDGYTRFTALGELGAQRAFAYVGRGVGRHERR
jgi:hypothetical protein